MPDNDAMLKEFIALGWWILEQKALYYLGHGNNDIHPSWMEHYAVPDHVYDRKEKRYEALAFRLERDPTASNMVGFNDSRPSCQLVLSKLRRPMPASLKPENKAKAIFG